MYNKQTEVITNEKIAFYLLFVDVTNHKNSVVKNFKWIFYWTQA